MSKRLKRVIKLSFLQDFGDVQVPSQLVTKFLPRSQVGANEAECGVVQCHAN